MLDPAIGEPGAIGLEVVLTGVRVLFGLDYLVRISLAQRRWRSSTPTCWTWRSCLVFTSSAAWRWWGSSPRRLRWTRSAIGVVTASLASWNAREPADGGPGDAQQIEEDIEDVAQDVERAGDRLDEVLAELRAISARLDALERDRHPTS